MAQYEAIVRKMNEDITVAANNADASARAGLVREAFEKYCMPDIKQHNLTPEGGFIMGIDNIMKAVEGLMSSFTNLKIVVVAVASSGNTVFFQSEMSGDHTGDGMGVPATGKRVTFSTMERDTFVGDKISECWTLIDMPCLMAQVSPQPAA